MRLLLIVCSFMLCAPSWANSPRVAIIIDDIGYRQQDHDAISLPGQFTYSVLPHTPYGQTIALQANSINRDVMLHVPMEALNGKATGPGGIMADMSEAQIAESLASSLRDIPYVIGVNNHMGSKVTQQEQPMRSTLAALKKRGLFFLDSRTTSKSKAEDIAKEMGITTLHRNIFLDHFPNQAFMEKQLARLINQAKNHQQSIAIAHPYPETLLFLKTVEAKLNEQGIELVSISTLLPSRHGPTLQMATAERN